MKLRGRHIVENILAALAAGLAFGVAPSAVRGATRRFVRVVHPLEQASICSRAWNIAEKYLRTKFRVWSFEFRVQKPIMKSSTPVNRKTRNSKLETRNLLRYGKEVISRQVALRGDNRIGVVW